MAYNCDSSDDLDFLVDLLEDSDSENNKSEIINDENSSTKPRNSASNSKLNKSLNNGNISSKGLELSNIDPLEAELAEMEKKMKILKDELAKKKNLNNEKIGFTKYSEIVEKSHETIRNIEGKEKEVLFKKLNMDKSEIHTGDTDSEDDEDNRNPMEPQLTSFGRDLKKQLLDNENKSRISLNNQNLSQIAINSSLNNQNTLQISLKNSVNNKGFETNKNNFGSLKTKKNMESTEEKGVTDPFSGIKLINPLVTQSTLEELLRGRRLVHMSTLNLNRGEIEGDWVTFGVIVSKSETKTSQKGSKYSIWQLSDLRDCTKVISLFLFSGAYTQLWKTTVGSVIGILNPEIMKERQQDNKRSCLTLSINTHEKILMLGTSKDLGWCKGRTKLGNCRQFVNKSVCEYCVYHIQREYQKTCSKRSEIQSSFTRVDPRKALEKKILGKNQVFYGGQLYGADLSAKNEPKKRLSRSHQAKDLSTLSSLKIKMKANEMKEEEEKRNIPIPKHLSSNQINTVKEVSKENEGLGEMLLAPTPGARNLLLHRTKEPLEKSNKSSPDVVQKELSAKELLAATKREKANKKANLGKLPQLGRGLAPGRDLEFDLMSPQSKTDIAKKKAAYLLKEKGLQTKEKNMKRNREKSSSSEYQDNIKKKLKTHHSSIHQGEENGISSPKVTSEDLLNPLLGLPNKKSLLGNVDINSEKFQQMLKAKSKHTSLIQTAEDEEVEKYYNKLEKKEMLENKMNSIMKVATTAVVCLKCKYKSFSASDICKTENHPLKSFQAEKRFYECKNCKRRTVTLEKFPSKNCSHCDQSSWVRVSMGKEKKGPILENEILSLRGDELNHYSGSSNQVYLHL